MTADHHDVTPAPQPRRGPFLLACLRCRVPNYLTTALEAVDWVAGHDCGNSEASLVGLDPLAAYYLGAAVGVDQLNELDRGRI